MELLKQNKRKGESKTMKIKKKKKKKKKPTHASLTCKRFLVS